MEIFGIIAGAAFPVGFVLIVIQLRKHRAAAKAHFEAQHAAEGVKVFEGTRAECDKAVHTLADAGVACWLEKTPEGKSAVHVDEAQAPQVPHLLAVQKHLASQGQNAARPVAPPDLPVG